MTVRNRSRTALTRICHNLYSINTEDYNSLVRILEMYSDYSVLFLTHYVLTLTFVTFRIVLRNFYLSSVSLRRRFKGEATNNNGPHSWELI